jgi:hypothetical protein
MAAEAIAEVALLLGWTPVMEDETQAFQAESMLALPGFFLLDRPLLFLLLGFAFPSGKGWI